MSENEENKEENKELDIEQLLDQSFQQKGIAADLVKILISDKVLPEDYHQNTELNNDERTLLSLLEGYSKFVEQYSSTAALIINHVVETFNNYGVSLQRKGRKEAVQIIENLFKSEEEEKEKEKSLREFLQS